MRNKYKGQCHVCGREVKEGEGYFQRSGGKWLIRCADKIDCRKMWSILKGKGIIYCGYEIQSQKS